MTSNSKNLSIDEKVWRCIRRYKRFMFSEVALITGATQEYLSDLIEGYEAEGIIKLKDESKTISEREYTVLKKLDLNVGVIKHSKKNPTTKNPKGYGRRVEVHIIEHHISVKDYRKSKEYRQRIRVIKLLQKQIGMTKLKELSAVSITAVRQIINESYPSPQKMMNRMVKNLNFDIEKLGQIRTNLDVKDFVRSYQNGNKK